MESVKVFDKNVLKEKYLSSVIEHGHSIVGYINTDGEAVSRKITSGDYVYFYNDFLLITTKVKSLFEINYKDLLYIN